MKGYKTLVEHSALELKIMKGYKTLVELNAKGKTLLEIKTLVGGFLGLFNTKCESLPTGFNAKPYRNS